MDIEEFKGRLRMLAAEVAPAGAVPQRGLSRQQIMGRLWSAELSRKAQRLGICLVGLLALVLLHPIYAEAALEVTATIVLAVMAVTAGLSAIVPYCTFRYGVHEALLALAEFPLNDPKRFVAAQRTEVARLSPKLMKDLCKGLYEDERLSN